MGATLRYYQENLITKCKMLHHISCMSIYLWTASNTGKAELEWGSKMVLVFLIFLEKHTIFFFCLDPSLQTKTTAVLNTKYKNRKRILVTTESLFRSPRQEKVDIPNAANCGSFFHFPKEAEGLIHVTLVLRSRSPMERSTAYQMSKIPAVHVCRSTDDTGNISFYLFFFSTLFKNELIKHGSKLLVDLLHLIDVAGHFVHRFHGNCTQKTQLIHQDLTDLTMSKPCTSYSQLLPSRW